MTQKLKSPAILTAVQSLNCFDFQRDWGYSDVYSLLKTFPLVFNKYGIFPLWDVRVS